MRSKYQDLAAKGEVVREVRDEAGLRWQFLDQCAGAATEIIGVGTDFTPEEGPEWTLNEAWRRVRPKRAHDCHDLTVAHQEATMQTLEPQLEHATLLANLQDQLAELYLSLPSDLQRFTRVQDFADLAHQFALICMSEEMPKAVRKIGAEPKRGEDAKLPSSKPPPSTKQWI